jgi:hypothetical protein
MSEIGFRPKGETGPVYHPDRDYAYITPTLMRMAIARLDMKNLPPEAEMWRREQNITDAEVGEAADALARAQRDFVTAADPVADFDLALARRDFHVMRYAVRQFLFSAIGEVFCAAWFKAVRDVSNIGEETPAQAGMVEFTAAVHDFVKRSDPETKCLAAKKLATAEMQIDLLKDRLKVVYTKLQEAEAALAEKAEQPAPSNWFSALWTRK